LEENQVYEYLKKLLPVAEEIGAIYTVHQEIRDRKYYTSDAIEIEGKRLDGREFVLRLEVEDPQHDS
jgi:hypothetical protein